MRSRFAGAYAVLRNPVGHREVNYDDWAEADDAVHAASLLMQHPRFPFEDDDRRLVRAQHGSHCDD